MDYLISVIIPTFNAEKDIENALNSLIKQTLNFSKIEVIIVDDYSTDNTLNVLKKYIKKYSNIKIISSTENSGSPSTPRNIGISKSKAKYIMFLDQDDYYLKNICETLYKKIEKENVDFISCLHVNSFDKNLINVKTEYNPLKKFGDELKINNINECPVIFEEFNPHIIPIWNKIYKKSFLKKYDIHFPSKCLLEDLYFTIQCYLNGNFILLNNFIGYLCFNDIYSTSHTPSKNNLNKLLCGNEIINNYLEKKKFKEPAIVSKQIANWTFLFLNNQLNKNDQIELLKRAQPLYKNFKKNNKVCFSDSHLIILETIFIKIFSSNIYLGIFISKIYKIFRLNKIYRRIYISNLKNVES